MPRHPYALTGVLILAVVLGYSIDRAPEAYFQSATVVLTARNVSYIDGSYPATGESLVTTSAVMVESLMGPQARALVHKAGGTTYFSLTLVNFYNQDYPEYSYPLATLTTQSADPLVAHRTFEAVLQVLQRLLGERQANVPPPDRASVYVAGVSGPLIRRGSLKRSLAALGLLAVMAAGMLSRLLDRYQVMLPWPRGWYRRLASLPVGHEAPPE